MAIVAGVIALGTIIFNGCDDDVERKIESLPGEGDDDTFDKVSGKGSGTVILKKSCEDEFSEEGEFLKPKGEIPRKCIDEINEFQLEYVDNKLSSYECEADVDVWECQEGPLCVAASVICKGEANTKKGKRIVEIIDAKLWKSESRMKKFNDTQLKIPALLDNFKCEIDMSDVPFTSLFPADKSDLNNIVKLRCTGTPIGSYDVIKTKEAKGNGTVVLEKECSVVSAEGTPLQEQQEVLTKCIDEINEFQLGYVNDNLSSYECKTLTEMSAGYHIKGLKGVKGGNFIFDCGNLIVDRCRINHNGTCKGEVNGKKGGKDSTVNRCAVGIGNLLEEGLEGKV